MKEYHFTPELAVQICEQLVMADLEEETAAWQYLIDTGLAWQLQDILDVQQKRLIDEVTARTQTEQMRGDKHEI